MRRIASALVIAALLTGCSSRRTPTAQIMNSGADVPLAALPNNPLAWRVVNSGANRTQHTMYTLYGNDSAIVHARAHTKGDYPAGVQLALVIWSQKEDSHWFGGSIPGTPLSVEYVTFSAGTPQYTRFTGHPLARDTASSDPQRTAAITNMQAVLMP